MFLEQTVDWSLLAMYFSQHLPGLGGHHGSLYLLYLTHHVLIHVLFLLLGNVLLHFLILISLLEYLFLHLGISSSIILELVELFILIL